MSGSQLLPDAMLDKTSDLPDKYRVDRSVLRVPSEYRYDEAEIDTEDGETEGEAETRPISRFLPNQSGWDPAPIRRESPLLPESNLVTMPSEPPKEEDQRYQKIDHRPVDRSSKQADLVEKLWPVIEDRLIFADGQPYLADDRYPNTFASATKTEAIDWLRRQLPYADRISCKAGTLNEVYNVFRAEFECGMPDRVFNTHPGLVNARNGVVCIDGYEPYMIENPDDYRFNYVIDADFLEGQSTYTPALNGFVATSLGGDENKALQLLEYIGYALSDVKGGKVILFLVGVSNSGKSIICNFLQELLVKGTVTNFPLHEFSNSFNGQQLCEAKLNISAEVEAKPLKAGSMLKALSGGDRITASRKFRDAKTMYPNMKMINATNAMPELQTGDPTDAIFNRIEVLPFSCEVQDRDPQLLQKLLDERSGIFTRAMWALCDLVARKLQFTRSEEAERMLLEYRHSANSFLAFEADCLEYEAEKFVGSKEVYEAYVAFCKENALEAFSKVEVRKHLQAHKGIRNGRYRGDGPQRRGYFGVGFKV